jgi:hypothetical protein
MRLGLCVLFLLMLSVGAVHAEKQLEIYPLSFRTAEELMPLLRPHAGPGTTLSGQGRQLIVRAEPTEQREIGALIKALDRTPRSLLISVRTASDGAGALSGGAVGGQIGGPHPHAELRVYRSESARGEQLRQMVRALEGRPAFIAQSVLVPVQQRAVFVGEQTGVVERVDMLELSKGFSATAHLHGGQVEVAITAEHTDADARPMARHQVLSTLRGRVGEWLPLGASVSGSERSASGLVHRSRDARRDSHQVWLKVDIAD